MRTVARLTDAAVGEKSLERGAPSRVSPTPWSVQNLSNAPVARLAGAAVHERGAPSLVSPTPRSAKNISNAAVGAKSLDHRYTGGPYPLGYLGLGWVSLGYTGLGDVFVFAYFGLVATLAPYYLLRPAAAAQPCPPALCGVAGALGALATAIIVVNNLRDRATDAKCGKRTLVVRLGARFARAEYATLVGGAYAAVLGLVAAGAAPRGWAAVLLTAPRAAALVADVGRAEGAALNPYVGATAKLQLQFGVLVAGATALAD